LRVLQLNLHKSKVASAELLLAMEQGSADITLVQEPWIASGNSVAGLKSSNYNLFYSPSVSRNRTAVLVRKCLHANPMSHYSSDDLTMVMLESGKKRLLAASCYMAHDRTAPPEELRSLVEANLSTDSFLLALQRFIGRRGCPQTIHCDNATNFVGASRHFLAVRDKIEEQADAIREFASRSGCEFAFTPPRAPHMGGLWEAVRQMFWRRWSREYVLGLQIRGKWHLQEENVEEGQLVVVAEDNLPPQQWLLGRIVT
ncbi:hypothetical protein KR054_011762, partial [Drosophila jambulina]